MMRSFRILCVLVFAVLLLGSASAASIDVVPATKFVRTGGHPNRFQLPFQGNAGPAMVTIVNGDPDGRSRVSSATVYLNGRPLATQRIFTQSRPVFTFEVQLQTDNLLAVELASAPGSFLMISVSQESSFGPLLISGVVRDRVTQTPITNARVIFEGSASGTVFTDASGAYLFRASDLTSAENIYGYLRVEATGHFQPLATLVDQNSEPSLPILRDFSLVPGGPVITGTVRDAASGQGIPGAIVSIAGPSSASVQADNAGSYWIDSSAFSESALTEPFFSVTFFVGADAHLGLVQSTYMSLSAFPTPVTQDFALLSSTGPLITGLVSDRQTGLPVTNARVIFDGTVQGAVFTDADGRYTFYPSDLHSVGTLVGYLRVEAPGYFQPAPVNIPDLTTVPTLPAEHDFSLLLGGSVIIGTIRDAGTQQGLSGATVSVTSPEGAASVVSQGDGSYSVDASYFSEYSLLDPLFSINFQVIAPDGYLGANGFVAGNFSTYPVPLVKDFNLIAATTPLLTGVVRDRITNLPIPNAIVRFSSGTVLTNENGRYTFFGSDLPSSGGTSGNLYVQATGYFMSGGMFIGDLTSQPSLPVTQDFALLPGGPVIIGTVRDASTGQGIAGATITDFGGTVQTDGAGHYEIDCSYFQEASIGEPSYPLFFGVSAEGYVSFAGPSMLDLSSIPITQDFELQPN